MKTNNDILRSPVTRLRPSPLARLRIVSLVTAIAVGTSGLLTPSIPARAYVDPTTGEEYARDVLRGFEQPEFEWSAGHRGVDLGLDVGDPVLAAEDGIVDFAGMVAGKPVMALVHADGIRTTYQPVHAIAKAGDTVAAGQEIGRLAHPVDGYPGLHWGALVGKDSYIDPLGLLEFPVIRLKPLGG